MLPVELASLLLAAVIPLCHAQTSSNCGPGKATCPDDVAMSGKLSTNFAGSTGIPAGWHSVPCKGPLTYGPGGATFQVKDAGDCPTIETDGAVLFGFFEVKMKAAPGQGIVSSIVLESADLDEVDWEFIGGEDFRTQSNYYGKGDVSTYDRMVYVPVPSVQSQYHTYAVNWTSAALTWLVDGVAVRTLNYNDAKGGTRFPQTPMHLRLGIWAGGDPKGNSPGTVTWAGGNVDYTKGPFSMNVDSVNVVNYSPGSKYHWKDNSGSWQSIQVIGGTTGGIVDPGQVAASKPSAITSSIKVTTPSAIVPVQSQASFVSTSVFALSTAVKPSTNGTTTATTANAVVTSKPSNGTTISIGKPTGSSSASVKPAVATGAASGMDAAGAAVAGLSGFSGFLMALLV